MRRSPRVVTNIVLLLAYVSSACSSWRVPPVSPQEFLTHEHPDRIRVREQGGTHVLSDPRLAADTLTGLEKGQERRMPIATVEEVAVRRFNVFKTVALIVIIPAVLIGTVAILMCAGDTGPGCVGS